MAKKPYISIETHKDGRKEVIEHKSKKEAQAHGIARRRAGNADVFIHDAEFAKKHGLDPRAIKRADRAQKEKKAADKYIERFRREGPVSFRIANKGFENRIDNHQYHPDVQALRKGDRGHAPREGASDMAAKKKRSGLRSLYGNVMAGSDGKTLGTGVGKKTRSTTKSVNRSLYGGNAASPVGPKSTPKVERKALSPMRKKMLRSAAHISQPVGQRLSLQGSGLKPGFLANKTFGRVHTAKAKTSASLHHTQGTLRPVKSGGVEVSAPKAHEKKLSDAKHAAAQKSGKALVGQGGGSYTVGKSGKKNYSSKAAKAASPRKSSGNVAVGSNGKLQLEKPAGFGGNKARGADYSRMHTAGSAVASRVRAGSSPQTHTINSTHSGMTGMSSTAKKGGALAARGIKSVRAYGSRTHTDGARANIARAYGTDATDDRNRATLHKSQAALAKSNTKGKYVSAHAKKAFGADVRHHTGMAKAYHTDMNVARRQMHKAQGAKVANAGFRVGKKGGKYVITDGGRKRYI